MKLFKSLFSITIVLAVLFCIGLPTYASDDTYSIEIPDGFTEFKVEGQDGAWQNADGSIIINLAVSENTSNVKVNPNDAGESYIASVENEMKASVTEAPDLSGEIVSINSKIAELGKHDAIRVFMQAKYTFENGEMDIYYVCYLFETQNYIHSFVIIGDQNISEFSDNLIKTVKINDEAVALRNKDTDDNAISNIIIGVIKAALIGVAVGVALALIKKFTDKKKANEDFDDDKAEEEETYEEDIQW